MNLLKMYSLLKMRIFHCYVSLPEGEMGNVFMEESMMWCMEAFAWCNADSKRKPGGAACEWSHCSRAGHAEHVQVSWWNTDVFQVSATPIFTDQASSSRSITVVLWATKPLQMRAKDDIPKFWLKSSDIQTQQILFQPFRLSFLSQAPPPQVLMHLPTQQPLLVLSSHLHWDQVRPRSPPSAGEESSPSLPDQAAGHQSSEAQELLCLLEDMSAEYEQVSGFRCWVEGCFFLLFTFNCDSRFMLGLDDGGWCFDWDGYVK